MGFFEELGIDMDEQEASGFQNAEPGFYAFEVSGARVQEGTSKDENVVKFVIDYALFNDDETPAGSHSEWYTLIDDISEYDPQDDENTAGPKAKKSRGFLKTRLLDLGFSGSLNDLDEGDLEGISGTLRLVANGEYSPNVRNVKVQAPKGKAAPKTAKPAAGVKANPFKKS